MEMGRKFGLVYKLDPGYYNAVKNIFQESMGQKNPWLPYLRLRRGSKRVIRLPIATPTLWQGEPSRSFGRGQSPILPDGH